jgi:tetratricopeptide (TPR) repeat protein
LSTSLIEYAVLRYDRGELDEAERLAVEGEAMGDVEDLINFSRGRAVRARIAADRGDDGRAMALAQNAFDYAFRTDFPSEHGEAWEVLAHVHRRAGRLDEAREAYGEAASIWARYGWTGNAERVRRLLEEL